MSDSLLRDAARLLRSGVVSAEMFVAALDENTREALANRMLLAPACVKCGVRAADPLPGAPSSPPGKVCCCRSCYVNRSAGEPQQPCHDCPHRVPS